MTYDEKLKTELTRLVGEYALVQKQLEPFREATILELTLEDEFQNGMPPEECKLLEAKYGEEFLKKYGWHPFNDEIYCDPELFGLQQRLRQREYQLTVDIERLLIDCKIYPLGGLSVEVMKMLESAFVNPKLTRWNMKTGELSYAYSEERGQLLEKRLDEMLLREREAMKKRLGNAPFFISNMYISPNIRDSYRQVINCYAQGFFEASCALARAVAESAEKEFIRHQGAGNRLGNTRKDPNSKAPWELLIDLGVPREIVDLKKVIASKASRVLHETERASEAATLEIIKTTKLFLEKLFTSSNRKLSYDGKGE